MRNTPSGSSAGPSIVPLAAAASLYWLWWDSFHETTRFLPMDVFPSGAEYGVPLPLVSCLLRPTGIALGALLVIALVGRDRFDPFAPRFQKGLLAAEAVLTLLFYGAVGSPGAGLLVCAAHGLVSLCAVANLVAFALILGAKGAQATVIVVIACLGSFALVNNIGFSQLSTMAPPWVLGASAFALLAGGFAAARPLMAPGNPAVRPGHGTRTDVRTPAPLVLTLAAYGFVFGALHTLGGVLASSELNINLPTTFATLFAMALLAALFLRPRASGEVWSKMRSTVLPLTLMGFLSLPLVPNNDFALAVMEAAQVLFDGIFLIGCVKLMDITYVDGRVIIAKGLLWKSLGGAAGIACAIGLSGFAETMTSPQFSLAAVVVTLLLSAATLWVGTDRQVRRVWSLRRELTPRQYNDAVLSIRCRTLSAAHGLTPRESEILLAIAQGRRAAEIQEEEHVSINTVRAHIQHVYAKLGIHSIGDLRELLRSTPVNERDIN